LVKPLVKAKALILGEDTVGKHSLLAKAGLAPVEDLPYLFSKVFELEDYRVNLSVWCFDDAVKAKVSRKEFYKESDVVVVIYSASDRWSYDSLEFWLKEASLALSKMPPVVIVANKKDQRLTQPSGDQPPVTTQEGFAYAEALAAKLGFEERLHPVAFIETSCLTSEGVVDVFRTAAELSLATAKRS
jgi:GTPase SAR1 family protein